MTVERLEFCPWKLVDVSVSRRPVREYTGPAARPHNIELLCQLDASFHLECLERTSLPRSRDLDRWGHFSAQPEIHARFRRSLVSRVNCAAAAAQSPLGSPHVTARRGEEPGPARMVRAPDNCTRLEPQRPRSPIDSRLFERQGGALTHAAASLPGFDGREHIRQPPRDRRGIARRRRAAVKDHDRMGRVTVLAYPHQL